ncbi:MAG: DUF928 domain-containing protein [Aphanocapsa sp. GSE-SYN-MK-11-07L]|jgi:hypothetical protein|nr:DUF928 domain-containing protein [Aphanocapsa sp. GSE-SYN-MK-11-07L]
MKQLPWISYCSLFLVASGLISPALAQSGFPSPPLLAQTKPQYDQLMRQGYSATAKRDYHNALIFFRQAERLRPSDRYAMVAIRNVSLYVRRGQVKTPLFIASGSGAPINRVPGATRGAKSCLGQDACLTALLPETDPELLMTAADYPILLFYIPQTSAQVMEVRFFDQGQLYQASFKPPQTAGIVGVSVASLKNAAGENLPPLKVEQQYKWDCTLIVDLDDPSSNVTVNGTITRASLNPELAKILNQAPVGDRLSLYATNNLWYDLISSLYLERKADPNNAGLVEEWTAILETVKLGDYALSPLL